MVEEYGRSVCSESLHSSAPVGDGWSLSSLSTPPLVVRSKMYFLPVCSSGEQLAGLSGVGERKRMVGACSDGCQPLGRILATIPGLLRLNGAPEGRIFQLSRCLEAEETAQLEGHFPHKRCQSPRLGETPMFHSVLIQLICCLLLATAECTAFSQGAQHVTDTDTRLISRFLHSLL